VAERIVDVLEPVEVQKHQRDALRLFRNVLERIAQPFLEEDAVGQAGERIIVRQRPHVRARAPHLREIMRLFYAEENAAGMFSAQNRDGRDMHGHRRAVAPAEIHLCRAGFALLGRSERVAHKLDRVLRELGNIESEQLFLGVAG